jgi:hypothetical protein
MAIDERNFIPVKRVNVFSIMEGEEIIIEGAGYMSLSILSRSTHIYQVAVCAIFEIVGVFLCCEFFICKLVGAPHCKTTLHAEYYQKRYRKKSNRPHDIHFFSRVSIPNGKYSGQVPTKLVRINTPASANPITATIPLMICVK